MKLGLLALLLVSPSRGNDQAASASKAKKSGVSSGKQSTPKKAKASKATPSGKPRYFELSDGKSHKFWEIAVDDTELTVRYGRIGADGRTQVKSFADADAAAAHAEKLVKQKEGKGYAEA